MNNQRYPRIVDFRFALNGPIRTEVNLDTRRLIGDEAIAILQRLKASLEPMDPSWKVFEPPKNPLEITAVTREERMVKPPHIAEVTFAESDLSDLFDYFSSVEVRLPDRANARLEEFFEKNGIKLTSMHLRMFSFGYATFRAEFDAISPEDTLTLNEIRRWIEPLGTVDFGGDVRELVRGRIRQFGEVVYSVQAVGRKEIDERQDPIPSVTANTMVTTGVPRWVHRVFGIRFGSGDDLRLAAKNIGELIFTASWDDLEDLFPRPDISICVSSGNSALMSTDNSDDEPWKRLNDVVEDQNAFFAKAEDLDEKLMCLINQISLDKERVRGNRKLIKEMDNYAIDIVDSREEVLIFRNDVDDYEGHLSPDGKRIWGGLWTQWKTGKKFAQIEKQVDIMGGLYDRIVTLLNQDQTKRLGSFALVFTLISGLSAFVDACSFTRQESVATSTFDLTNTAVVIVVILVLAFIFWRIIRR